MKQEQDKLYLTQEEKDQIALQMAQGQHDYALLKDQYDNIQSEFENYVQRSK